MFGCRGVCAPRDPAADTVKISMPTLAHGEHEGENPPYIEEREAETCSAEDDEAQRREEEEERQQQEAERLHLEERERRRREEAEERARRERQEAEERARRERQEAEERARREQEEAAERSRREREEAARAEAARQGEAERVAQERERKARVGAFLKEHGYSGAAAPKKTMLRTKYPIHTAAKMGDPRLVAALLEEGADPAQKDSAGKTALQVAQQKNKGGSHANVLRTLGGA